jgi:hypothetical protein
MHAHLLNHFAARAPIFVASGVTGVRELGTASLDSLRAVRGLIRRSDAPMPRLIASAVLIDGSPPVHANRSHETGNSVRRVGCDLSSSSGVRCSALPVCSSSTDHRGPGGRLAAGHRTAAIACHGDG